MKKGILIFLLAIVNFSVAAFAADFTSCQGKYGLCTTAQCTPIPGKKGLVSCNCDVRTGYSLGAKNCIAPKVTNKGELIHSRYYPITSYVRCSNNRPWAWCLDKPCIVDKNDPSKAACACSVVKNLGDYVAVTDTYSDTACTTGIISSATIQNVNQINDFLKTQKDLPLSPIKILKK